MNIYESSADLTELALFFAQHPVQPVHCLALVLNDCDRRIQISFFVSAFPHFKRDLVFFYYVSSCDFFLIRFFHFSLYNFAFVFLIYFFSYFLLIFCNFSCNFIRTIERSSECATILQWLNQQVIYRFTDEKNNHSKEEIHAPSNAI